MLWKTKDRFILLLDLCDKFMQTFSVSLYGSIYVFDLLHSFFFWDLHFRKETNAVLKMGWTRGGYGRGRLPYLLFSSLVDLSTWKCPLVKMAICCIAFILSLTSFYFLCVLNRNKWTVFASLLTPLDSQLIIFSLYFGLIRIFCTAWAGYR